jgi:transcriptional regulator with XRE-family HTH domain
MPTIQELRESFTMSREELAIKAHVSVFTIQRLESGRNIPRYNTLEAIAKVFGVKSSEIQFPDVTRDTKLLPKEKGQGH